MVVYLRLGDNSIVCVFLVFVVIVKWVGLKLLCLLLVLGIVSFDVCFGLWYDCYVLVG